MIRDTFEYKQPRVRALMAELALQQPPTARDLAARAERYPTIEERALARANVIFAMDGGLCVVN